MTALDLTSRMSAIEMNMLPQLLYLSQTLQVPPERFTCWDKIISRFVWNRRKPRIKYSMLQLSKEQGGMALHNLKDNCYTAQLRTVFKWCNQSFCAKWKDIEMTVQNPTTDISRKC